MILGCCASLDKIEIVRDIGYDFVELGVGAMKPESPESEFEAISEIIYSSGIAPEVWNCLLPGDMKLVGPEVDSYRIERYLRTAFERIEELGGEIVVFGSGAARTMPDGFPADEAHDQLKTFLKLAGQVAGAHGITITVEPLNSKDTNSINTITQAVGLVKEVDHPFVKVLVDSFHMLLESEPVSAIAGATGLIAHAHVADTGRLYPGSGEYPTQEFITALQAAGYDGRLSVECYWNDFNIECDKAYRFLQKLV